MYRSEYGVGSSYSSPQSLSNLKSNFLKKFFNILRKCFCIFDILTVKLLVKLFIIRLNLMLKAYSVSAKLY